MLALSSFDYKLTSVTEELSFYKQKKQELVQLLNDKKVQQMTFTRLPYDKLQPIETQ